MSSERRKSGTMKGRFTPKNPRKYKGVINKIVYRSSWERMFMEFCDDNPNVLEWNSEGIVIPYISPLDGITHRYFVDFWIRMRNSEGKIVDKIIEIKPHKETLPPVKRNGGRQTARYLQECKTFAKNQAKWNAARDFARRNGIEFVVVDEYGLGIKKRAKSK